MDLGNRLRSGRGWSCVTNLSGGGDDRQEYLCNAMNIAAGDTDTMHTASNRYKAKTSFDDPVGQLNGVRQVHLIFRQEFYDGLRWLAFRSPEHESTARPTLHLFLRARREVQGPRWAIAQVQVHRPRLVNTRPQMGCNCKSDLDSSIAVSTHETWHGFNLTVVRL